MIKVLEEIFNNILEHSKESYPNECCGALLGTVDYSNDTKNVVDVKPLTNINKERAADRYEIDPAELLSVEKKAGTNGLDVVGFYHSHPDHPSRPSQFDRDRGWPDYSYIIVAVEGGKKTQAQSWHFDRPDDPFKEETLEILKK